jgi:hypothetical protein
MSEEAKKHRKEKHVLCDEDIKAFTDINRNWRRFCLTWMTPGRTPWMASFGYPPAHCPDTAEILEVQSPGENSCVISTQQRKYKRYRYELVNSVPPLAEKPRWLLNKVWSVWDDEEDILLFE